jgi:hypothetical protein
MAMKAFGLERADQPLGDRVIPAIALPAHGGAQCEAVSCLASAAQVDDGRQIQPTLGGPDVEPVPGLALGMMSPTQACWGLASQTPDSAGSGRWADRDDCPSSP